jgi:hypothetical protein
LGWTLYSFLESREMEKQNAREHFSLKLINVASPGGTKVFADITGTGAG